MKTLRLSAILGLAVLVQSIRAAEIPPHLGLAVPGVHAYTDWPSVPAGGNLRIRSSASAPYRLQIIRLGKDIDNPASGKVLAEFSGPVRIQPIYQGSYAHVAKGLAADEIITALSLEVWVRPHLASTHSALLGQYDSLASAGYGLITLPDGKIGFYLGDGGAYRAVGLTETPRATINRGPWYHMVATWDGREKAIWINDQEIVRAPFAGTVKAGLSPLRLAAYGTAGLASQCLDGDLAMPVIYSRALTRAEIRQRFENRGQDPPRGSHVLAAWPLAEEDGDRIEDVSGHERQGQIIDQAQWMIGGPKFYAWNKPRFGYDPQQDPTRGHALRFSSDTLTDCRWDVTEEYTLPLDARPGFYAARFLYEWEGQSCIYHATFVVSHGPKKNRTLVLANATTWTGYNNVWFAWPRSKVAHNTDDIHHIPGTPKYSFYRDHVGVMPAYYIGTNRRPNPAADPYLLASRSEVGFSHLVRAERFFPAWLDQAGYDYDMTTDMDLDRDENLLDDYEILVIQGHSEYWSKKMHQAVKKFLHRGGRIINISGNTCYWTVEFNQDLSVVQARKYVGIQGAAGGRQTALAGELWHSGSRQRGGLAREAGMPAWEIVGLETNGWWGAEPYLFGGYTLDRADHPLFSGPNRIELSIDAVLGQGPNDPWPRAVGGEADVRLSTILSYTTSIPPGAIVPQEPSGIVTLARNVWPGFVSLDYFGNWAINHGGVRSEMILWQRDEGGQVFSAGSISMGWAIYTDPNLQRLMQNVLAYFGVPLPAPKAMDFNADRRVDYADFVHFAASFGSEAGKADWHGQCDLNGNGVVDFSDFLVFVQAFEDNAN